MRTFLLLTLLGLSATAFADNKACGQPYVLQVGPEFSSNFMIGYLGKFTLSVAQNVGCGTRIQGTKDYESFLTSVIKRKADIYLIPHHFMQALQTEGFTPILQRQATSELLYITHAENAKNSVLQQKAPLQVYTPGQFSIDQYGIDQWLKQQKLTAIQQNYAHTYASVMMRSIKQTNIIATVPDVLFDRTPENIQAKLKVYPSGIFVGAYIVVLQGTSDSLIDAIRLSKDALASDLWSDKPQITDSPYSKRFEESFIEFKKSTK